MERRYSAITDLYGVTPPEEPRKGRGYAWLIIVLMIAAFVVLESVHVVKRLRPEPPPDFVGTRLNSGDAAYRAQERLAQECWDYAIHNLQGTYPYGQTLPKSPTLGVAKAPAIRIQCWPRLRRAWTQEGSWQNAAQWDSRWLTNPHGLFRQFLRRVDDFFRNAL